MFLQISHTAPVPTFLKCVAIFTIKMCAYLQMTSQKVYLSKRYIHVNILLSIPTFSGTGDITSSTN